MKKYRWIQWRKFLLWLSVITAIIMVLSIGGPETWDIAFRIFGLLFQLLFAVMFIIIQFVALFWFLARGRTYWILPGETGAFSGLTRNLSF